MIGPDIMNVLLGNRRFRALLTERASDATTSRRKAAQRVLDQIEKVKRHEVGSFRYNLACAFLLQYINEYLVQFGEAEPPYLPKRQESDES